MENKGLEALRGVVKDGNKHWLEALHKDVIHPDVDQRVVVNTLGDRLLAQVRASLPVQYEADIKRTAQALEDARTEVNKLKDELTHHLAIGQAQKPRAEVEAWVVRRLALEHSLPIYEQLVGPAEAAHTAAIERMRDALRAQIRPIIDSSNEGAEAARREAHGHTQLAQRIQQGVGAAHGLIEKSERWME